MNKLFCCNKMAIGISINLDIPIFFDIIVLEVDIHAKRDNSILN